MPHNTVIETPDGHKIWLRKKDVLVHSPAISQALNMPQFTRMSGADGRKPGMFEEAFKLAEQQETLAKQRKHLIGADRSPIAGLQFNQRDLERAYDRIGKGEGMKR